MSLINLFVAAKHAVANWQQRRRAFDELMALDDRSLADIGLHRSQIPAMVEGAGDERTSGAELPAAMGAPVLGAGFGTHRLFPKV